MQLVVAIRLARHIWLRCYDQKESARYAAGDLPISHRLIVDNYAVIYQVIAWKPLGLVSITHKVATGALE